MYGGSRNDVYSSDHSVKSENRTGVEAPDVESVGAQQRKSDIP